MTAGGSTVYVLSVALPRNHLLRTPEGQKKITMKNAQASLMKGQTSRKIFGDVPGGSNAKLPVSFFRRWPQKKRHIYGECYVNSRRDNGIQTRISNYASKCVLCSPDWKRIHSSMIYLLELKTADKNVIPSDWTMFALHVFRTHG